MEAPPSVPMEEAIRAARMVKATLPPGSHVVMERGGISVEILPGETEKAVFTKFMEEKRKRGEEALQRKLGEARGIS